MRIGGLASGMDTDNIIRELMAAERIPLDKLEQSKTKMEWQRDAFRDINKQIAELDTLITNMRTNSNILNPKTVTSTMPGAITATGGSGASEGSYKIAVSQLASTAINSGQLQDNKSIETWISDNAGKTIEYTSYGPITGESGNGNQVSIDITAEDTINSIVKKINNQDKNVRAFYDEASQQFVMETRNSGVYTEKDAEGNAVGKHIAFDSPEGSFFNLFGMTQDGEKVATDAKFTYNDTVELTSKNNRYTLNGMAFTFNDVTGKDAEGNSISATLSVTNDVDKAIENITDFVNKYNELVETLNGSQNEPVYRDFPPLTEAQMEEMSEKQIELWEEKARSGLLKGESLIPSALTSMRSTLYSSVEGNSFNILSQIGITTTKDYMDGGKLEINEAELRTALQEDSEGVNKLLLNSAEGAERGIFNRIEDSLENTVKRIEDRAGKGSFTNEMYTMGRELKNMENRISAFEDRMKQVEDRYWRQFNAMEQAISMMNNQSAMLMNFGGNQM